VTALPAARDIREHHGDRVAFAFAETALGPLFGRSDVKARYLEVFSQMCWICWNQELHAFIALTVADGGTATSAIDTMASGGWDICSKHFDTPRDPLMKIALSRWTAAHEKTA